jgi:Leucine-rich repeat (LRR) protein
MQQNPFSKKMYMWFIPFTIFSYSTLLATEVIRDASYDEPHLSSQKTIVFNCQPLYKDAPFEGASRLVLNFEGDDIKNNLHLLNAPLYSIDQFAGEEITIEQIERLKTLAPYIYELDLRETYLGNEHLKLLSQFDFSNLRKLKISDNRFDDEGMTYLPNFESLSELEIVYNKVTAKGLMPLLSLKSLEVLNAGCTYIEDAGIEVISDMENLKSLNIRACGVSDKTLDSLFKIKTLREVNISANQGISSENLSRFLEEASKKGIKIITDIK